MAEVMTFAAPFVSGAFSLILQKVAKPLGKKGAKRLGIKEEVKNLEKMMKRIICVLENAEKRALHEKSIQEWLSDVRDALYDVDDIIDDCGIKGSLFESSTTASTSLPNNWVTKLKIGERIKEINTKIEGIERRIDELHLRVACTEQRQSGMNSTETGHGIIKNIIVGKQIVNNTKKLVEMMSCPQDERERYRITAITGMPGIGKSTLAQKIFNEVEENRHFAVAIWICVSKEIESEKKLLKEILRKLEHDGKHESKDELQTALEKALKEKTFFLVLDDVWDDKLWESWLQMPCESCAPGSHILVTTRDNRIARRMQASHLHEVNLLSTDDGWLLLRNSVFKFGYQDYDKELVSIGKQIVEKCCRLPLAIKAIAGILRSKEHRKSEWLKILQSEAWSINWWFSPNGSSDNVMNSLYLSYADLPSALKLCFVYCSLFPKNYHFLKESIVAYWIAEGFLKEQDSAKMAELGAENYQELIDRNLVQKCPLLNCKGCTMHDLVRDFATELGRAENFFGNRDHIRSPSIRRISIVEEGGVSHYDHDVVHHKRLRTLMFFKSTKLEKIPDFFCKLRYVRVLGLRETEIKELPASMENLVHLRHLDLSNTPIAELPKSVGKLRNLQFLILQSCMSLRALPEGISRLQGLQTLDLYKTPIMQMPEGLGGLKQMHYLSWIARNDGTGHEEKAGNIMAELKELKMLRFLEMYNLERLLPAIESGTEASGDSGIHVKNLILECNSPSPSDVGPTDRDRIQKVFEELRPPSCLERLRIRNFFGPRCPSWMSRASLDCLESLIIVGFEVGSRKLPALGQLPYLVDLQIRATRALEEINSEFFVGDGRRNAQPFRRLETLSLHGLWNLKECSWDGSGAVDIGGSRGEEKAPFPRLKRLQVTGCPKLRSLWNCLQNASSLTSVSIKGAQNLEEIPELPAIKKLIVLNCSALTQTGEFRSLNEIRWIDKKLDALPQWLRSLAVANHTKLQRLFITTNSSHLIRRLCKWDIALDWTVFKNIPNISAVRKGDGSSLSDYFFYSRTPFSIEAKLQGIRMYTFHEEVKARAMNPKHHIDFATTATPNYQVPLVPATIHALGRKHKSEFPLEHPEVMHACNYTKLPLGFHFHLPVITVDGKTRDLCIDQSYHNDTGFITRINAHTHLPYSTAKGESGTACFGTFYQPNEDGPSIALIR